MKSDVFAERNRPGESGVDDIRKFDEFIEFRLEVTRIAAHE
jgi:hypothetical protein